MKLIKVIRQHKKKLSDNTLVQSVCLKHEKADCLLAIIKKRFRINLLDSEIDKIEVLLKQKDEFKLPYEEKDYFYQAVIENVLLFEDGKFAG